MFLKLNCVLISRLALPTLAHDRRIYIQKASAVTTDYSTYFYILQIELKGLLTKITILLLHYTRPHLQRVG